MADYEEFLKNGEFLQTRLHETAVDCSAYHAEKLTSGVERRQSLRRISPGSRIVPIKKK